jgi:hypothetical protein
MKARQYGCGKDQLPGYSLHAQRGQAATKSFLKHRATEHTEKSRNRAREEAISSMNNLRVFSFFLFVFGKNLCFFARKATPPCPKNSM